MIVAKADHEALERLKRAFEEREEDWSGIARILDGTRRKNL